MIPLLNLSGYTYLHTIYEDEYILVCHAREEATSEVVVIKTAKPGAHARNEYAKLHYEHELLTSLAMPGLLRSKALLRGPQGDALVFAMVRSITLRHLMTGSELSIPDFFTVAGRLLETVGRLHERRVVHMNLRPDTILVQPQTLKVYLTGLSEAVPLGERYHNAPEEGSPPYMAPERTRARQSGATEAIDLYAIGVALYEWLCGTLPLRAGDPVEWAYVHSARLPEPPEKFRAMPEALSAWLLRMLDKNPAGRYESAATARRELLRCVEGWHEDGAASEMGSRLTQAEPLMERNEEADRFPADAYPDSVRTIARAPIVQASYRGMREVDYEQMLDMATVTKAAQCFAEILDLTRLERALLALISEFAGATRGGWIVWDDNAWAVQDFADIGREWAVVEPQRELSAFSEAIWTEAVEQAATSGKAVFVADVRHAAPNAVHRSVCAVPIKPDGGLQAVLYLDNPLLEEAFAPSQEGMLRMLASQVLHVKILNKPLRSAPALPLRQIEEVGLTPREREVLSWMAAGLSNKQIGEKMFVSVDTVKLHVKHIFVKMGVKNRVQAVMLAQEKEIFPHG